MNEQLSLLDAQTIGAPYQPSSPTSIAAAVAAGPKVGTHKREILDLLSKAGDLTQDEISLRLYMPRSTVCARVNELEHEGFIHKTNEIRPTQYGRGAVVYRLSAAPPGPARAGTESTNGRTPAEG